MATSQKTVDEILAAAGAARSALVEQDLALEREINAIDDIEFERPLNNAERGKRKTLRDAQGTIAAATSELSFVTLRALDSSSEVLRILNAMKSVNKDLSDAQKRLEKIKSATGKFKTALAFVEKVVQKVGPLLI